MAEYIEREALGIGKRNPDVFEDKGYAKGWNAAIDIIQNAPAADVRPVVRGQWSRVYDDFMKSNYDTCSCCGKEYFGAYGFNFCPNCGADMMEES